MQEFIRTVLTHTPQLIVGGCVILIASFLVVTAVFLYLVWVKKQSINNLGSVLSRFSTSQTATYRGGLSLESLDVLRTSCSKLRGTSLELWRRIDRRIELYTSPQDQEGWFIVENPRSFLSYENVIGQRPMFSAVPGILTGSGLILTFTAILIALLGVHYDKANSVEPITGIEALINGLSGKFLSSIVALILSIIFTLIERAVASNLRTTYERFISKVTDAVPVLSTSRILLDIHVFSAKQTVSVHNLSSEVVDRLTNAFNERIAPELAQGMALGVAGSLQVEIRPTMERMVESLDRLQLAVVSLESQKQESLTGEIERMTKSLETAITQSLETMGSNFRQALSGSAKDEFSSAEKALGETRTLLVDMNTRFESMQTAFSSVVTKAEQTTIDQLRAGHEQTEAMTAVMQGLMNKLQETADQSLSSMHTQLTRVVDDLSGKVAALSIDMMDAAKDMAGHSQQSAAAIIEKTDAWSESTSVRLEALLSNIEDRSRDFREAGQALLEAKTFMNNLLVQNATALSQMAEASRNVQAYSAGLVGQSDGLRALNQQQLQTSTKLQETVASLNAVFDRHQALLETYDDGLAAFKDVIEPLDQTLARIMSATTKGLSDYNEKVEANFDSIVEIADKLVPKAASLLSQQIDDLREQLETLGEVIAKAVERVDG